MVRNDMVCRSSSRLALLAGTSALVLLSQLAIPSPANASQFLWTSGDLNNSGVISANSPSGAVLATVNGVGTFSNSGTITSDGGVGDIGVLLTNTTISSFSNQGKIWGAGIGVGGGVSLSITNFNNSGTISSFSSTGVVIGGKISTLTNSGTISSTSNVAFMNSIGTVSVLINSGKISGSYDPIYNDGVMGTISNSGAIVSTVDGNGIGNFATIGTITNSGTIASGSNGDYGVQNNSGATITVLNNTATGLISGQSSGVKNGGVISTLNNAGTIQGTLGAGVYNAGTIGTLLNSGSINIVNNTRRIGTGTTAVSIGSSGSIGTFANSGTIIGSWYGIIDSGTIGSVINTGTIHGSQYAGIYDWTGVISSVVNSISGTISGTHNGILNNAATLTAINNHGLIYGTSMNGIRNQSGGVIGTITNSGTIESGNTGITGIWNWSISTIGTIDNSGLISGHSYGVANQGVMTLVSNSGTITGSTGGLYNMYAVGTIGTIGTLENSGLILSVNNVGTIGTLHNSGSITSASNGGLIGTGATAVYNSISSSIGSFANSGTITGTFDGFSNAGLIGTVNNSGLISGGIYAALENNNGGTIGTIINSGTIGSGGSGFAIDNVELNTISVISNSASGLISASSAAVNNSGSIGTVSNSGTITAQNAMYNGSSGSIGTISNSGTIVGTTNGIYNAGHVTAIVNSGRISGSSNGIENSSWATIGTITNSGTIASGASGESGIVAYNGSSIGTIVNNSAGLISANSYGIASQGVIALISNSGTVTGTDGGIYNEIPGATIGTLLNSGSINLVMNLGLIGTGATAISIGSNGSIGTIANSGTIVGTQYAIVNQGSLSSLSNGGTITSSATAVYNTGTVGSLINSGTIAGSSYGVNNSGVIVGLSDSGAIVNLTNSGTIGAGGTAISISSSGSIGIITNSGVISGSIVNFSANDLTINGGSGATWGTLTGGTIVNAASNLSIGSGQLILADYISVGASHTVVNTGTIQVGTSTASTQTIDGNYKQTGGGLLFLATTNSISSAMSVTGTTSIANSTITISGSGLVSGETFTIVHSTGTGSFSSDTYSVSGTNGATAVGTISGNNLIVCIDSCGSSGGGTYSVLGKEIGGAAAGMGTAVDALSSSTNTAVQAMLTKVSALSTSGQQVALRQLSPSQIAPASQASNQAAAPAGTVVEQHETSLSSGVISGDSAGSDDKEYALWGQWLGGAAVRDSTAAQDGFRSQNMGLVTGIDWQTTPDLMLGVAVGYVKAWSWGMDNAAGSFTGLNSYQVIGYGLYRQDQAFIDGQMSVGINQFDQRRAVGFMKEVAHSEYLGQHYSTKFGGGYDVPVADAVTATPMVGWRFTRAVTGAYTETGAGAADLTVARGGVNSLTQDMGVKLDMKVQSGWGVLVPEIRIAWVHDYEQGLMSTSGLIGGVDFTSGTVRPTVDGMLMNLAVGLQSSDEMTFRAEYEGEIRHDYQSHTGLLKATMGF